MAMNQNSDLFILIYRKGHLQCKDNNKPNKLTLNVLTLNAISPQFEVRPTIISNGFLMGINYYTCDDTIIYHIPQTGNATARSDCFTSV